MPSQVLSRPLYKPQLIGRVRKNIEKAGECYCGHPFMARFSYRLFHQQFANGEQFIPPLLGWFGVRHFKALQHVDNDA